MEGYSVYSTYSLNKKLKVLGRFDKLTSNTLAGAIGAWNLSKNGSTISTGFQYVPAKSIKMALNYYGFLQANSALENKAMLLIYLEFKF